MRDSQAVQTIEHFLGQSYPRKSTITTILELPHLSVSKRIFVNSYMKTSSTLHVRFHANNSHFHIKCFARGTEAREARKRLIKYEKDSECGVSILTSCHFI